MSKYSSEQIAEAARIAFDVSQSLDDQDQRLYDFCQREERGALDLSQAIMMVCRRYTKAPIHLTLAFVLRSLEVAKEWLEDESHDIAPIRR